MVKPCYYNIRKSEEPKTGHRPGGNNMYVIEMAISKCYSQGEYSFPNKREAMAFLSGMNHAQIETVKTITKYNRCSRRNAWNDFFEDCSDFYANL